ncbi:hypothetical protein K505DRAFT_284036 [Melanomma pulvis-pyrius CBS 109.77]|uniref:Rhodopsin domain-containing protein n=1 Tax=Melanomma pulvis-pyrius CBS 109.77 TaxID=1314802 RepID=A0A6A6X0D2_9PLEO|nr:hypothetical protein K505DRAFT_284036 [Melanomma pulvis-pyrius CBS 109.77]
MVMLATLCVALRFRARRLQKAPCMFDDWLCLVALLLTWSFQAVNLAAVFAGGAGLPIATVAAIDPTAITTYLKIIMVNFLLWVVTVSVVQLSILFFYIRLFGVIEIFRWICYVFIFLITAFGIAGFFSQLFSCSPVSKSWEPMKPGTCVEGDPYCSAIGIIHVLFDFGIVFLPMPLIWKLKVAMRSKMILSLLLCLGLVASIISLLKIVCLFDLTGIPQADITDYLWLTILLQTLELPIGIICCCVPSLKPVVVEVAPKFRSVTSRLLSYARSTTGGTSSKSYATGNASATGSTNGFARPEDSNSQIGRGSLGNKTSAHAAEEVELVARDEAQTGHGIEVVNSYSVRRQ